MIRRILAMVLRYLKVHVRHPLRLLEAFFWPVMDLFVWGMFSLYLRTRAIDGSNLVSALLSGLLFWDVVYRSHHAISFAVREEIWTRNLLNLFLSPLKTWEWVVSIYLYGLIKAGAVLLALWALATSFYGYDIGPLLFYAAPFLANLLLLGWGLGLFTAGLLLRWGLSAEGLVWGVPVLLQPFSAVYSPLSSYPDWIRPLCALLPSAQIMEAMREVLRGGPFPWNRMALVTVGNLAVGAAGAAYYLRALQLGRRDGRIIRPVR